MTWKEKLKQHYTKINEIPDEELDKQLENDFCPLDFLKFPAPGISKKDCTDLSVCHGCWNSPADDTCEFTGCEDAPEEWGEEII